MAVTRPTITGITVHMRMPDGSTQTHEVDPSACDALAWSDRGVQNLGKFYEKGGHAEGKLMHRKDFLHHFPHGAALIGDQEHLPLTPEAVEKIWNHPKADGTGPAFLCKATINVVNGK